MSLAVGFYLLYLPLVIKCVQLPGSCVAKLHFLDLRSGEQNKGKGKSRARAAHFLIVSLFLRRAIKRASGKGHTSNSLPNIFTLFHILSPLVPGFH